MKVATTLLLLLLLLLLSKPTTAFIPQCKFSRTRRTQLYQEAPQKKLSSAEIQERARQVAQESAPATLFDEDLLEDMRNCVQMLDRRVTNGPKSLSAEEVSKFESATKRIVEEMNAKLADGGGESKAMASPAVAPPVPAPVLEPAAQVNTQIKQPEPVPLAPPVPAPEPATPVTTQMQDAIKQPTPSAIPTAKPVTDISMDDDGIPAFDAKTSGMGLARGTANTYAIPGMDEMSPEEYRAALQKSVSDRQSQRKDRYAGVVGNRAAHSYLESLGWGGASKGLGVGKDDAKDDVKEGQEGSDEKSEKKSDEKGDEGGEKKKWTAY